ncbi:hypothetical protein NONI108955_44505 [Nocardia ninae]
MEIPCHIYLRFEDSIEMLWLQRGEDRIVEGACRVDHRRQWPVVGDRRNDLGQLLFVGCVASPDVHRGAELGQLGHYRIGVARFGPGSAQ